VTPGHGLGRLCKTLCGVEKLLGRLKLTLRLNDLRAAATFGLRLLSDRPHHVFVEVDTLELDVRNLDPPGLGLLIQNSLNMALSFSRSDSIASSSCCPSTKRSVVCAS
jgi:hypothetical protein